MEKKTTLVRSNRTSVILTYMLVLTMLMASFTSCNKDEVIEANAPVITLDSETGIYTVKSGHELTIAPEYKFADDASFSWLTDNGDEVCTMPQYTATWATPGEYYIELIVTNSAGSASAEMKVEVEELAIPRISLPITGDKLSLAVGAEYMLAPEITNTDIPGFNVQWTINGKIVSNEPAYMFKADTAGNFNISIKAENEDGSDEKTIAISVLDNLPYELSFPTPSLFQSSTTRYTFTGRPVYLTPVMSTASPHTFIWTVNGNIADCTASTLKFTPSKPGEYIINVATEDNVAASVKVICVDGTEADHYRKASASSSATSCKVYEWCPAPGQFIGDTQTGGMSGTETTLELANAWAETRLDKKYFVSLGGFGGYIIVGFDHSIPASDGNYDFTVMANAFLNASGSGGSNEPGIVYVMQDINGNGLPDDEWYELRGSETGNNETLQDYAVTYYRPSAPKMNVQWTDNYGASGTVDYLKAFHRQDYYYPAWIPTDSYTLRGTRLKTRTTQDSTTGFWDNSAFSWGYADNIGSDNITGDNASSGSGQRNGFRIKNAMYQDLTPVKLQYIDFIKVQTGVNAKAGILGEVSTEVCHFQDMSLQ